MLTLNNLPRQVKKTHRVGRGIAAGQGKTAGRGTKGQKSRSGWSIRKNFEGGQTPLAARIAKRHGFRTIKRSGPVVITQKIGIALAKEGKIDRQSLVKHKLITKNTARFRLKILGRKN